LIVAHLTQQPEDFSMFEIHVLHRQEVISTVLVLTRVDKFCRFLEKPVFSMEKTVPAKIVFAGRKNPGKISFANFAKWKK
jgi:hypothetical protein